MAVNKVILVGNVGKDPETRYLDENTPVCKFPLATSEVYRNRDGQKVEQTEWHNVVLWRGLAKVAEQYVKKGSQLYIEGRIRSRSYDDRDGVKRYITEIVGDNMQMLSRRQDDNPQGGDSQYGSGSQQSDTSQSPGGSPASGGSQQSADTQPSAGTQPPAASQPSGSSQPSQGTPPGAGGSTKDPHDAGSAASDNNPDISGPGDEPDDLPF